jgi:hypothetical protein
MEGGGGFDASTAGAQHPSSTHFVCVQWTWELEVGSLLNQEML